MPWTGPFEAGISQSMLNKFLICPYRFYLYAILGLEEKQPTNQNLIWGDTFHKGLELLIKLAETPTPEDWSGIDAAVDTHLQQYVPFPATFPISIKEMLRLYDFSYKTELPPIKTEEKFVFPFHHHSFPAPIRIHGKKDGCVDNFIIEHKCKGYTDSSQARQETPHDLQVNVYGLHTLQNESYDSVNYLYDIIRIPDGKFTMPLRRMNQTLANWVQSWYRSAQTSECPISQRRHLWLDQFWFTRSREQIEHYSKFTLIPILQRLVAWWEHVTRPSFDHNNPDHYNHIFYRTPIRHFNPSNTENFKPEYFNFLTGTFDIGDLTPVASYFPELEGETD